jgi:hypothetical protein
MRSASPKAWSARAAACRPRRRTSASPSSWRAPRWLRSAARDWRIETQPGRLRLTTIDALCAGLARQMPLLSRFGAQPATVDDASRHYREAARRALDHLEDEADAGDSATRPPSAPPWPGWTTTRRG